MSRRSRAISCPCSCDQAAMSSSRVHLESARAHLAQGQLRRRARDFNGAKHAYTQALRCTSSVSKNDGGTGTVTFTDIPASFVCHVRLAQLAIKAWKAHHDHRSVAAARWHLECAWELRSHLTEHLKPVDPVGCYFRAVGFKLARLYSQDNIDEEGDLLRALNMPSLGYDFQSNGKKPGPSLLCSNNGERNGQHNPTQALALPPSISAVAGCPVDDRQAWGQDGMVGDDDDAEEKYSGRQDPRSRVVDIAGTSSGHKNSVSCGTCGDAIQVGGRTTERESEHARDPAYCEDCIKAYEQAVAEGPRPGDISPCAGCKDTTQTVTIEPDGMWYCEACIEEYYEEGGVDKDEGTPRSCCSSSYCTAFSYAEDDVESQEEQHGQVHCRPHRQHEQKGNAYGGDDCTEKKDIDHALVPVAGVEPTSRQEQQQQLKYPRCEEQSVTMPPVVDMTLLARVLHRGIIEHRAEFHNSETVAKLEGAADSQERNDSAEGFTTVVGKDGAASSDTVAAVVPGQ